LRREVQKGYVWDKTIVTAFREGRLKSRDEMNLDAAADAWFGQPGTTTHEWAAAVLDAAWGVGDEQ